MFLPGHLYEPLAQFDDAPWQAVLERRPFWRHTGTTLDAEHVDLAFHILMQEGQIALGMGAKASDFEFDAVPIADDVLTDSALQRLVTGWSAMHAQNFGPGLTTKMGLYVIRAGGTLGFHTDGPVFLKGARVDLGAAEIQRGLIEMNASHRTILPLRFNAADDFMICSYRAPLQRGELFEFSNILPHAYFNRGKEHAVLLVTTYLEEKLLPREYQYSQMPEAEAV
ncbi:hypothetical protein ACKI2N_031925 [Cupriavidus sp. 30B13]|uniref:hypothetical protein n=1 Tax=Cupriavidus sp. 30B13 TaxID=3384241 RepID=UPI003B90EDB7